MANNDIKNFIPSKFVSGSFDRQLIEHGTIKIAYLSCKFHGKWMNLGKFEKLTKYKPYEQRNAVKEVEKAIYQNVVEHDNVPTSGIKILPAMICSRGYSLYDPYQNGFGYASVLVSDPRGFIIALTTSNFFSLLVANGGSLNAGELPGEYVYVWNTTTSKFTLMAVNDPEYSNALSKSRVAESTAGKCLTDRQLNIGSIYTAHHLLNGDYMYLGKLNTYSAKCHATAIHNKSYDCLTEFLENDKDRLRSRWITELTTKDKHILVNVSDNRSQYVSQYAIRSSCNGMFTNVSTTKYDMTYDNVMKNVKRSLIFNKIDLSTIAVKPMPYELFTELVESDSYNYYSSNFSRIEGLDRYHYTRLGYLLFKTTDGHQFGVRALSKSTVDCVELVKDRATLLRVGKSLGCNLTLKSAYDLVKPITMAMAFENGNECPDIVAYGLMLMSDTLLNSY